MRDLRGQPKNQKERLQRLIGDIREGLHHYEPRPVEKRDWARYDEAQAHELADTLESFCRIIEQVREPEMIPARGRPSIYLPKDLAKIILLQQVFQISNRATVGYVRVFKEKLGIRKIPCYKTIERAYGNSDVYRVLAVVFDETVKKANGSIRGFSVDGSGIPTSVKGNWERDKSENKEVAGRFDGAVMMVGLPVQVVTAFVPRPIGFVSEVRTLRGLVEKSVMNTGGLRGIVSADAGFQSRENCDLINEGGGVPRIFPRRDVSRKSLGSVAWAPMLTALLRDPQRWLREYHQRSLSETDWWVYKNQFPRPLRRRLKRRRGCEHLSRFVVYNLVRLSRAWRVGVLRGVAPWEGRLN